MAKVTLATAWFAPGGWYFFATEPNTFVEIPDHLVEHLPAKSQVLNLDATAVVREVMAARDGPEANPRGIPVNPGGYSILEVEQPPAPPRMPILRREPAPVVAAEAEVSLTPPPVGVRRRVAAPA